MTSLFLFSLLLRRITAAIFDFTDEAHKSDESNTGCDEDGYEGQSDGEGGHGLRCQWGNGGIRAGGLYLLTLGGAFEEDFGRERRDFGNIWRDA